MPVPRALSDLAAIARRHARRADEADDLLQSALLVAMENGRCDLANPDTRRWLAGVIRNRAVMDARTAARRRRRERGWSSDSVMDAAPVPSASGRETSEALSALAPSLRITALLALNGCTRAEIGWLLSLSDTALRQRISQLKRALANVNLPDRTGSDAALAFGLIRQALLMPARQTDAFLASHDPDGHLFVIGRSQIRMPRQQSPE
jgi:DNA-directed RNA polymerase specialized sigma24 family protein